MINQAKAAAAEAAARAKAGVTTAKAAAEDVLRRRRVAAMTDAERAEVRAVFDRADTLRRGRVDAVEVRRALHELSGQWMPDDELATFWAELVGPEGATTIGFDEFLLMLGPTMFPPKSVRMLQAATSKAREAAKPLAEQATERAASLAHGLSDTLVTKVLDAVRKSVTADALDPDMPRPLRKAVSYAMTAVLADVEIEVREKLLGLLHGKGAPLPPPEQRSLLARLVHGCRAGLLYTLRPHDKTMWVQLRNPAFLLLKLVSVFPLYGVQPAFFLLTFLLIDKGDEYQLVGARGGPTAAALACKPPRGAQRPRAHAQIDATQPARTSRTLTRRVLDSRGALRLHPDVQGQPVCEHRFDLNHPRSGMVSCTRPHAAPLPRCATSAAPSRLTVTPRAPLRPCPGLPIA